MKMRLARGVEADLLSIMSKDSALYVLNAASKMLRAWRTGEALVMSEVVAFLPPDTRLAWRDVVAIDAFEPLGAELAGAMLEDRREIGSALLCLRILVRDHDRAAVVLSKPTPERLLIFESRF